MINKVITTFSCGHKIIRTRPDWILRYRRGLRFNGQRPHLIQAFGSDFTDSDFDEIFKDFRYTVHPSKGRVTVNGEFLKTCLLNRR